MLSTGLNGKSQMRFVLTTCIMAGLLVFVAGLHGENWLTHQHDYSRSGVTSEEIGSDLGLVWRYESQHLPKPAWPAPAKNDYYHDIVPMRALVVHDKAFHVIVSGDTAYFGSSADDKVYALDTDTGEVKWAFFTGGPVRLAPTIVGERLYVGSDDGCVYCLSANDGALIWKYHPGEGNRILPGNERMISIWPVRAGMIVDEGKVYFSVGLFPKEGAYLVAVDAKDGSEVWKQQILTSDGQAGAERASMSGQGYMLSSAERLYVPAGRVPPMVFAKDDGKYFGAIYGVGAGYAGTYALLTTEGLVSGPGGYLKGLHIADTKAIKDTIAVFGGAVTMVVKGKAAYVQTETTLSAYDREAGFAGDVDADANLWSVKADYPYSMIMAGDTIYSGSNGKVTAYRSTDGQELWRETLDGAAQGLAAADGKLFFSTDTGKIYCFAANSSADSNIVKPVKKSSVYPKDELTEIYAAAARHIVEETRITKGYCLDLGSGRGRLAYELAKITDLQIVGIDGNAKDIGQARQALDDAGFYGRVSFMRGGLSDLPFNKYLFNLIVSDQVVGGGPLPAKASDVFRVLRPCGGVAYLGHPAGVKSDVSKSKLENWTNEDEAGQWKIVTDSASSAENGLWTSNTRGKLAGAGQWTHQYAEPGNSSNANDKLIRSDLAMQWFGRPGPGRMADRHSRAPAPVSANGRLFVRGEQYLFGVDAYNGAILWEKAVPEMETRINMMRDCSYMAADDDYFYAAIQDKCRRFNGNTGKVDLSYSLPKGYEAQAYNWGLVAYVGDTLLGSCVRKNLFYNNSKGPWYDGAPNSEHYKICSDVIFAYDKADGKPKWQYEGVIMHSAIAMGNGKVYFVENRNEVVVKSSERRLGMDELWKDLYLVALDVGTGEVEWEKPVEFMSGNVVFYLSYADDTLVVLSSNYGEYTYWLYAFEAGDGAPLWDKKTPYTGSDHGGQLQRPVIIDGVVYQQPYDFDLRTGEQGTFSLDRGGHGCGGWSGTNGFLFGRGATPRIIDLAEGGKSEKLCSITRPGCWINIVCANGLVLMPEGGSGCACAFPILTSMAYAPK